MEDKFVESIAYILPAAVTGYIAYYMFKSYLIQKNNDKKWQLLIEKKKESMPIKLQAYERMLLFCERIHPIKMTLRIPSITEKSTDYVSLLILTIEQEFEHNLVQQLYLSDEAWNEILNAKNTIENKIHHLASSTENITEFKEMIFKEFNTTNSPTEIAISKLKDDVAKLIS